MNEVAAKSTLPDGWSRIALILVLGYCLMGRSFAYLGIPPWHLFIGEIILAAFLLAGPRTARGSWAHLARRIRPLRRLLKFYLIFLVYGIFQVLRGIALGHPPLTAVRDLAFNYYPVFFLLGLWVGLRKPNFLPRLFRALGWFNGVYGICFILFLSRIPWTIPGVSSTIAPVLVFGQPQASSAICLLGLLAFEQNLRRISHLLVLNSFVLLGVALRGEWLAFAVGLLVWSWLTKKLRRLVAGAACTVLLLGVMYAVDLSIPAPESRSGTISTKNIIGRALAPIDPDLAADYTSNFQNYQSTALWRTVWWVAIWEAVHADHRRAFLGFGYGYPLGDLVPYLEGDFIQTPHSVFFYVLAYTGWIGVGLFALFQVELLRLLVKAFHATGQAFGVALWAGLIALGLFEPYFESPYGAIPFYLIMGCVLAMSLRPRPIFHSGLSARRPPIPHCAGEPGTLNR